MQIDCRFWSAHRHVSVAGARARPARPYPTTTDGNPPVERRRRLSQAALAVTNQKVRTAYSPVVIAKNAWLLGQALFIALYFTGMVLASNDARHALTRVAAIA